MLTLELMLIRLGVAILLGAIIGLERELAGKEAGIRTDIMVAAGAAIFSIIGLELPYIVSNTFNVPIGIATQGGGFLAVLANVVVGVGFLGAGIIIKHGVHVLGLTTAATVWLVAAIGVLCGIGLINFAVISAIGLTILLSVLRRLDVDVLQKRRERNE